MTAKTEQTLAERAGHLEMLRGGKKGVGLVWVRVRVGERRRRAKSREMEEEDKEEEDKEEEEEEGKADDDGADGMRTSGGRHI